MKTQKSDKERKVRTQDHINADLSVNHVERVALLNGFSIDRTRNDYGYDLEMSTYSKEGEIENGTVYMQLKAKQQIGFVKQGKFISYQVDVRDMNLWKDDLLPVIFVVYDTANNLAYYLHIQEYIKAFDPLKKKSRTVTLNIPSSNVLTVSVIESIAIRKRADYTKLLKQNNL